MELHQIKKEYIEFHKELKELINKHNIDKDCNIPDYILAYYLISNIYTYKGVLEKVRKHEGW